MKNSIFKNASIYFLSIILLIVFSVQLTGQDKTANGKETINVSVDNFRVISTNPDLKPFKYKIADAFAINLIVNNDIHYIDKKQIISRAAKRLNIQTDVDHNVPLDMKVDAIRHAANEMNIRFILSGTITEFNNKFRIEISIYDMLDQSSFKHNLGFYEGENIYESINDLSLEAVAHIIHKPVSKALRKIAVIPFVVNGNPTCLNSDLLVESIGQSIYSNWSADEYEIIPWWKTDNIIATEDRSELKEIDADAFILGDINIDCAERTMVVTPKIYLLDPDEIIEMSDIKSSSIGNDFIDQLIYDITDVSSSLLAPEGGWLYAPYLLKLNSYKEYLNLGIEYSKIKYYYLSSHFLLKALEINPDGYDAKYYLAYNFKMRGNIENAKITFLDLINSYPDSLDPKFQFANLLLEIGEIDEARIYLLEIESVDEDYNDLQLLLGKTLMMQSGEGYSKDTFRHLSNAMKQNPDNAETYYLMGVMYQSQGEIQVAEEMYSKAVEKDTLFEDAAWALRRIKIDLAIEAYQDARYSEPGMYTQEEKMELYRSAEVHLLDAMAFSEDEEVFELLRQVYLNMSELDKAGLIVEDGIEKGYFDKYTYYRHAEDLRWYKDEDGNFAKAQLDESVVYFIKYLDTDPFNPLTYRRIGSSYFRNKNYRQAEENYEQSLKRDSLDVTNYMNLAEVQLMIGEYEKARLNLEAVKEIGFSGRYAEEREQTREYLEVVSEALLRKSGWENNYYQLMRKIDEGKVEVQRWNFNTFQNWLNSDNKYTKKIKADTKKKVNILTEKMKKARKLAKK